MGVLRVRVGGAWVDVAGASDAVWVDPAAPTDPNMELWYDTDAPNVLGGAVYAGRNLLDNGQMAINQRALTSLSLAVSPRLADRWGVYGVGVGVVTAYYGTLAAFGQNTPAGRPRPANVQYLLINTAEAAGALAASDYLQWNQYIEGQFLQHLNWGTVDAQPLTYSFDIYSTIATSYVVELYRNETTQRSISKLITVPAGWSTQVVTFPGDTITPITNDTTGRLQVAVNFTGGTTFTSGVLQTSWANTIPGNRWAGISNAIQATVNNVVSITNAQLEVGTVATPYEVRRFDDELAHCQRYAFFPAYNVPTSGYAFYGSGFANGTASANIAMSLPVTMRAIPTLDANGVASGNFALHDRLGANYPLTAITVEASGLSGTSLISWYVSVSSGLTVGRSYYFLRQSGAPGSFGLTADI